MLGRAAPLALVVDDDPVARAIVSRVASQQGFAVAEAGDGLAAVRLHAEKHPSVVFLDIEMPGLSGLDALREIREADPHVPVVIVSGAAAQDLGVRAFDLGAVNFIGKPIEPREIRFVLDRIRAAVEEEEDLRPVLPLLCERRTALLMPTDLSLLGPVVAYLGRELRSHYPGYDLPVTEARLALYEAIANALEHGNLEIDYDAKTDALSADGGIRALIERRLSEPRFRSRRVRVEAVYRPNEVTWSVADEGRGFSPETEEAAHRLGDPTSLHGRGIRLMKHVMHDVVWNATGNEVRMTLRVHPAEAAR